MTPERARELAHRVPHTGHAPAVPEHGSIKRREIRFTKLPPGQAKRAAELLAGLEYLEVSGGPHLRGITDAQGRLMVLATHNTDISDAWEREGEDPEYFYTYSPNGYATAVNIMLYAMSH